MQIDHLYGMSVTELFTSPPHGQWAIRFESGHILTNLSEEYSPPPAVVGAMLQRATFAVNNTVLYFDNGRVVSLVPRDYSITDDADNTYYPQRPMEVDNATNQNS